MLVELPANGWEPRPYQQPLWDYLIDGGKRAVWIAHRRAGKDALCLNWTAFAAMQRAGNYVHMLPAQNQARRAIWNAVDPHTGRRRIFDAFPREIIAGDPLENEMTLRLVNGSTWTVLGSDNFEGLIGSPPVGLVFSEWAISDPAAWAFLAPILRENDGWGLFISTPRGRNHAYTFFQQAQNDPEWFSLITPATETDVFTPEQLKQEQQELINLYGYDHGMSLYEQEYLCSFQAAMLGAYYGREMEDAERSGRIGNVPHDPSLPVHTAWDIGYSDATAIWFFQIVGKEIHAIDYLEHSNVAIDWYVKELQKRRYTYGSHNFPADIAVRELGTGKSRLEVLRSLGITGRVIPAQSVQDGINAVRMLIPRIWFDKRNCARGIECLQNYHRVWDEKRKVYSDRPYHSEHSHAADAIRYFAMANVRNAVKRDIVYSNKGII